MSRSATIDNSVPQPRTAEPHAVSPAEGPFELRSETTEDPALIVTAAGDIDSGAAEQFAELLRERLASTTGTVILDLSDVALLSTAGVVVLMELSHRTRMQDRSLVLVTQNRNVDRVLSVLGVGEDFDKVATVSAARDHVALAHGRSG